MIAVMLLGVAMFVGFQSNELSPDGHHSNHEHDNVVIDGSGNVDNIKNGNDLDRDNIDSGIDNMGNNHGDVNKKSINNNDNNVNISNNINNNNNSNIKNNKNDNRKIENRRKIQNNNI